MYFGYLHDVLNQDLPVIQCDSRWVCNRRVREIRHHACTFAFVAAVDMDGKNQPCPSMDATHRGDRADHSFAPPWDTVPNDA